MKLYNTLTKKVEEFIPNNGNEVRMYTCGPTVYHFAHIGNLRTYISEDILEKALNYVGYKVIRCMNITDVGHLVGDGDSGEDKMAVAAKREHKSSLEIAKYYTDIFKNDCDNLNVKWPEIVSPATENIDEYIKIISKLLEDGYAYISDGNVYYDTTKFPNYYELSGRNKDELMVAVREDIKDDTSKRNPFDFGLWFTNSKFDNQELKWDSPWGVGYPGWHIECSGISIKYLGEYLDIHCGAEDAIFPHHTNEIAQSEAFLGHKWCNYWIHLSFLNDESGKMSKSNGEFLTLSLLKEKGYNPLSYRFMCLQSHYHKQLVFTYDALDIAENQYKKLLNKISLIKEEGDLDASKFNEYDERFKNELHNNLNTANTITILYDLLKDDKLNGKTKLELIKSFDKVLSLDLIQTAKVRDDHDEIMKLIEQRNEAKKNKDFATADKIRNDLQERGIILVDSREGTTYKEA
ncbi:MAG: cysteine--tRNA ligase [Bacilli bacterium]|nr:cysteine--tRNA ligase [Bacilli bacterium]